jgi:hypothetical protein
MELKKHSLAHSVCFVCVGVVVVTMGDVVEVVVVKSIWGEIKSLGTFVLLVPIRRRGRIKDPK